MVDSYYKLSLFMVKHLLTVWFIDVYGGFLSPTRYTGMVSLTAPSCHPAWRIQWPTQLLVDE